MYEYHYKIIELLENANEELQDFKNYFQHFNDILHPYMVFEDGKLKNLLPAQNLTSAQKTELLSYLWRMEIAKKFKLFRYEGVMASLKNLENLIDKELKMNK